MIRPKARLVMLRSFCGAFYVAGYLAIRRGAVPFPVTPGSVGYNPAVTSDSLILHSPIGAETPVRSKICTAVFAPLLSIDRLICHTDVAFHPRTPTLPYYPFPP